MAVIRVEKTQNYTVMSNHHLRNKAMSLKAKGLMSLMLSLPQELKIYLNDKEELIRTARELNTADISYERNRFSKVYPVLQKRIEDKRLYSSISTLLLEQATNKQ